MSYATPQFWLFLAATLAIFSAVPPRTRLVVLLGASLVFYGLPDPARLIWLGLVTGIGLAGALPGWPRAVPLGATALLLLALVLVKFGGALGLALPPAPPGYSFYTFTVMAHLIDRSRRPAPQPVLPYLLHVAWFPKLFAGPIERSNELMPQFGSLAMRPGLAALGFTFLLSGLVKKLVIADNLAPVVDAAYAIPDYAAPLDLLIASYFFAFQIYCDFSGYSDIAVGLSALVGLRLSRNFDHPYLSPSVTAFWSERWHITLGRWFRDYLFIPLGGSRHGRPRRSLNLMAVFALSGLWHAGLGYGVGWGFLIWGLLNGLYVVAESFFPRNVPAGWTWLRVVLTFHLVLLTWVFFRAADLDAALTILSRIAAALPTLIAVIPTYPFTAAQGLGALLIGGLLAVELAARGRNWGDLLATTARPLRWAVWYTAMTLLLLLGTWQGPGFIYAQF